MVTAPELSFRGAKQRGNLAVHSRITGYSRRNRNCLPEIATGAKRPRNDTSGKREVHQCPRAVELPRTRRSLTAATDAIGACRFNGGLYGLQVPSRDCTPRALPRASRSGRHGPVGPRNDKSESFTPQNAYRKSCQSAWRSLSAATDAIGACHFNDSLYGSGVRSRAGLSPLLQRIAGSYGKNSTFHSQFSLSGGRLSPNRYLQ